MNTDTFNKIPLLGLPFFKSIQHVNARYKMNEIINNFLLARDISMPEMRIRQHVFT